MQYSFLHDRKNYMLLGQKYRPFFFRPIYAKQSDYTSFVPFKTYLLRILGSLILIKAGYEFGVWDGAYMNEKMLNSKVVDMETEEQIYDYLFNKNKTAVLLMLYTPGHYYNENFH